MRTNTYILYAKATLAALMAAPLLWALPACSDNKGEEVLPQEEEQYAKLVISLGSLDNATPAYTKTVDDVTDPDKDDDEYERYIKDWWLVVMHNGTVEQVLSNTKGNQATATGDKQNTHEVSIELLIDEEYDFYAFANLPDANKAYLNSDLTGKAFDIKKTVGTINAESYKSGTTKDGPYFPMSSYKYSVKVTQSNTPLKIPLIRLLSKVSVEITNSTNLETITVKSLKLDKFRTNGSIYLLPYDEAEDKGTQNLLAEDMASSYMPQFPPGGDEYFQPVWLVQEEGESSKIAKDETKTFWCYVNETNFMANKTGLDNLQVTAKIDDRDDSPKDTNFDFIRRNDWLKIPLLLSDVSTTITFGMQHMPIGGLPATITIPEGLTIPEATFWTQDHGGDITITYELKSISSLTGEQILHCNTGDSYGGNEQHPFTSAVLENNDDDLLISAGAQPLPTDNANAEWLDASTKAFDLSSNPDGESGSFTVTAQELAGDAEARIRLNLVIGGTTTNGTSQKVVVPYTIIIKNKKSDEWETTTGGN